MMETKWNMGIDSVGTLTKNYSREQLAFLITRTQPRLKVKVLFDPDASRDGKRFARNLSAYYRNVMFVKIHDRKDPAQLSRKDVQHILDL